MSWHINGIDFLILKNTFVWQSFVILTLSWCANKELALHVMTVVNF